jgi:hypothetical protein
MNKHYAYFLKKRRWYSRTKPKPVDEYGWNTPRKKKKK